MAFERQWPAVAPQQLTADGGTLGQVQIADTRGFKVGQKAVLVAVGQANKVVQIKRVMSATLILVGPPGSPYSQAVWTDISAFTTATGAYIYAEQQDKTKIPQPEREEATYETEPTVAWRTIMVDQLGQFYGTANPLPVQLSDGSINIQTLNAELRVQLSAKDNDPVAGDVHSSIRIGDGTNELKVNQNGSLNVVVENNGATFQVINQYGDAPAVPIGATTNIVSYQVPAGQEGFLQKVAASGENVGRYDVKINGNTIETRRTWWSGFNTDFNFMTDNVNQGYPLNPGDVIIVTVLHNGQVTADFNARIQLTLIASQS